MKTNLEKLPKWAQGYITTLQNSIDVLERDKEQYKYQRDCFFKNEPTNVYMVDGLTKKYLIQDSEIAFVINEKPIYVRIRENNILEVMGQYIINIKPRASNTVHITMEK